jgi:hypothetical protein
MYVLFVFSLFASLIAFQLAQHFSEMLLSGIEHELVPENRQYALWAGCVYCFETIDIQVTFCLLSPFILHSHSNLVFSSVHSTVRAEASESSDYLQMEPLRNPLLSDDLERSVRSSTLSQ